MKTNNDITTEINEIGNILSNISGMSSIRKQIHDIGGSVIAAEDDYMFIKCCNIAETARRLRGVIANCVIEPVDKDVIFLKGGK